MYINHEKDFLKYTAYKLYQSIGNIHLQILSFLPLDYPTQKRKSPVKSFATIGGALHS